MAARWAFEALAVAQFKDNPHERNFYAFDKTMANADYKTALYLPELQDKLHVAGRLLASGRTDSSLYARNLLVLRNELQKEQRLVPQLRLSVLEQLQPEQFTPEVATQTQQHLEQLRKHYLTQYAKASRQKDDVIYQLTSTPEASAQFRENIKRYRNERVVDLVTNVGAEKKMVEHNGELSRKVTPVYADPADISHPLDYRAHFYAPTKHFLGRYFATVPFNLAVIWLMTLVLYLTLYFRVLRRLLQLKLWGGSRKTRNPGKAAAGNATKAVAPKAVPALS